MESDNENDRPDLPDIPDLIKPLQRNTTRSSPVQETPSPIASFATMDQGGRGAESNDVTTHYHLVSSQVPVEFSLDQDGFSESDIKRIEQPSQ